jgi:hypothetical protein
MPRPMKKYEARNGSAVDTLWLCQNSYGKWLYSGFTHWKRWFSIVMLVYQRVCLKKSSKWCQHLNLRMPGPKESSKKTNRHHNITIQYRTPLLQVLFHKRSCSVPIRELENSQLLCSQNEAVQMLGRLDTPGSIRKRGLGFKKLQQTL